MRYCPVSVLRHHQSFHTKVSRLAVSWGLCSDTKEWNHKLNMNHSIIEALKYQMNLVVRKQVFRDFDPVRHKPVCAVTGDGFLHVFMK